MNVVNVEWLNGVRYVNLTPHDIYVMGGGFWSFIPQSRYEVRCEVQKKNFPSRLLGESNESVKHILDSGMKLGIRSQDFPTLVGYGEYWDWNQMNQRLKELFGELPEETVLIVSSTVLEAEEKIGLELANGNEITGYRSFANGVGLAVSLDELVEGDEVRAKGIVTNHWHMSGHTQVLKYMEEKRKKAEKCLSIGGD